MRNQWTREIIIRTLVEREAQGLSLTVGGNGVDTTLYASARRIFGSWRNALQAAGIAPQRVLTWERWSPARILVMIRHLAKRSRPLTSQQMDQRYHNLVSTARRHYGSWNKAVLAAGVEPTRLQRVVPWTQERVVEAILTRALRGESLVAGMVEPRSLVEAAHRFFGGWSAAVKVAGVDPGETISIPKGRKPGRPSKSRSTRAKPDRKPPERWSKERVISLLLARMREQKPMHSAAIARDDQRLYDAIRRHLRNWSEAMHAVGLDPEVHRLRPPSPPRRSTVAGPSSAVSVQSPAPEALRPH